MVPATKLDPSENSPFMPQTRSLLKISAYVLSTFFRIYLIVGCISRTVCMYIARFLLVLSLHSVSQLLRSLIKWSRGCLGTLKKLVQHNWTVTFFLQFLCWYSDVIEEIPVFFVHPRDTMVQVKKQQVLRTSLNWIFNFMTFNFQLSVARIKFRRPGLNFRMPS